MQERSVPLNSNNKDEVNREQIIKDCLGEKGIKSKMTFTIDLADFYSYDCMCQKCYLAL